MIRSLGLVTVLALLAGPARGQDGEAHTIKVKKAATGETIRVEKRDQGVESTKVVDLNGNVLKEEDKKTTKVYVYRETVLERVGAKRPTRLKRQYEKAEVTTNGAATALPYQGKTVLIEKTGGKYTFRIEGGDELTGDDAKQLNKEFNKSKLDDAAMEKLLLPHKAVKVGETWKLDTAAINKALEGEGGLGLHPEKTVGTGKLTRAYKKGGHQFGVIAVHLDLAPKSFGEGGKSLEAEPGAKVVLEFVLDVCIDGSSAAGAATSTATISAEMLFPDRNQPKFRITFSGKENSKHKDTPQ